MSSGKTFQCSVITPEKIALECEAESVVYPAHDGEMGILNHRAPVICKLGIGALRIQTSSDEHRLFVDGGFAQMVNNHLTLLTEQARTPDEIDASKIREALEEARGMPISDDASFEERQRAIQRAEAQLKMVSTGT